MAAVEESQPCQPGCKGGRHILNCSVPAVSNLQVASESQSSSVPSPSLTSPVCTAVPGLSSIHCSICWPEQTYIDFDLFPVGVFDGGVIALDPHILHELRWNLSELLSMRLLSCVPVRQLLPTPPGRLCELVSVRRTSPQTCTENDNVVFSPRHCQPLAISSQAPLDRHLCDILSSGKRPITYFWS